MIDGLLASILGVVNGSWATRLEVKAAGLTNRIDGIEKLADERHKETLDKLKRIDDRGEILLTKLDRLLARR